MKLKFILISNAKLQVFAKLQCKTTNPPQFRTKCKSHFFEVIHKKKDIY